VDSGASYVGVPSAPITGRIPALDGLRGTAILLVLVFHWLYSIPFHSKFLLRLLSVGRLSWSGVDLFFVLSGFLIGGILLDAKGSSHYFRTFYSRRAYRILPLYGALIVLSLFATRLFGESKIPLIAYLFFVQNFWFAHLGGFGYVSVATGVTWSLAIEEQFYLIAPAAVRWLSRSRLCLLLVCVVVTAPVLRLVMYYTLENGEFAAYVLTPCRADALCLGVLLSLLVRTPSAWAVVVSKRTILWWVVVGIFGTMALLEYHKLIPFSGVVMTAEYSLLALFYACWLLLALTSNGIVHRTLCMKWLMKLGTLAYFTYLFHRAAMEGCRRLIALWYPYDGVATRLWSGVVGITLTLLLAAVSWRFFEQPLLRRGRRYEY
jgi:peptidoglycan/LPS O-acetylase OafA/YrhL